MPGHYATTPEQREWLRTEILKVVESQYAVHRRARTAGLKSEEPLITVGWLYDWFNSNRGWGPFDHLGNLVPRDVSDDKKLRGAVVARYRLFVRSQAEWLRRHGKLGSSIGYSEAGREARCYEPA